MGQRKTWSLHHVPFSMLWETVSIDYNNNWDTVVNSLTAARFLEAANDRQYKNSFFAFTWKSQYFSSVYRKINLRTGKNGAPKLKKVNFRWIRNANRGSNETSCGKSHFVSFNSEVFLLNLFFRQKIQFEDKKIEDGIDSSVLINKAHVVSCSALKAHITEAVEKANVFSKNRKKRRSRYRTRVVKRRRIVKLLKIIPRFTRTKVKGYTRFISLKKKAITSKRRFKRLARGVRYGVRVPRKDPKFWTKTAKKALTLNHKIPTVFSVL